MVASSYFVSDLISCRDQRSRLQQPITDPGYNAPAKTLDLFTG
jgi:hypothetical protein